MPIGIPEIVVVLVISFFAIVPMAALIWVVLTLLRIRSAQEQIQRRLEGIERSVPRGPGA
jgi:hypothetical protein